VKSRKHRAKVEIIRNMKFTTVRLLVLNVWQPMLETKPSRAGAAGMIEPSAMLGAFRFLGKRAGD
jgi:hypothetical protein